jgi:hypothetical protein
MNRMARKYLPANRIANICLTVISPLRTCKQLSHPAAPRDLLSILFVCVRGGAVCRHVHVHTFSVMRCRNISRCCSRSRLSTGWYVLPVIEHFIVFSNGGIQG